MSVSKPLLLYHELNPTLPIYVFSEAVVHQGLIPRKVTVLMVSQDSYNGKYPAVCGVSLYH